MPRDKRLIPPDGYLHIMCRGNNKQFIFHSPLDYRNYYELLFEMREENKIEINHYCLMNNHIHLIVHVKSKSDLARYMKQVNLTYFHYYRRRYGYAGHIWQGRFKSNIIEKGSYLIQCGKYIELNPVKAGIVEHPREYKYSSYQHYAYGKKDKLIKEDPEYLQTGRSQNQIRKAYRDFVIDETIKEFIDVKKYLGTDRFVKKMERYFSIKNSNKKRGWPKGKKRTI